MLTPAELLALNNAALKPQARQVLGNLLGARASIVALPGATGGTGAGGATGGSDPTPGGGGVKVEPFRIAASAQSTKFGSATKLICGAYLIDPNDARWGLSGTSVATFYATLETTNASNLANVELFQFTGTGSPVQVATMTTASTTAANLTATVSTAFRPGANAGIFQVRVWITTPNTTDQATLTGAGLEITP